MVFTVHGNSKNANCTVIHMGGKQIQYDRGTMLKKPSILWHCYVTVIILKCRPPLFLLPVKGCTNKSLMCLTSSETLFMYSLTVSQSSLWQNLLS